MLSSKRAGPWSKVAGTRIGKGQVIDNEANVSQVVYMRLGSPFQPPADCVV